MARRTFEQPPIQMAQQIGRMRMVCPDFERTSWHNDLVRWEGNLQPTDASARYRIAVEYRLRRRPAVTVLEPDLKIHENGSAIPHRFGDGTLCLYLTNSGEWHPSMYVAEAIIPWAAHWLYHYELWHATGEWMGGGVHPAVKKAQTR